jgi:peptide-methionine (R)-S-oxide reductase
MNKRYFLLAGITTIGSVWLSGCLPDRAQSKTKKTKFEITKTEQEWRKILTPA